MKQERKNETDFSALPPSAPIPEEEADGEVTAAKEETGPTDEELARIEAKMTANKSGLEFIKNPEAAGGTGRSLATGKGIRYVDNVFPYLKEIGKHKLLTVDEEKKLAKLAQEGDKNARRQMIEANLRLVISIAKGYKNKGVALLDLIQEGNIGLMKALDRFEYHKGYKFCTYAFWWIRQGITLAIANQARTIRIPVHMHGHIGRMVRMCNHMAHELGRKPEPDEVAQSLEIPVKEVTKMQKIIQETISLDTPVGESGESFLSDIVEDHTEPSPMKSTMDNELAKQTRELLSTLVPREEKVLRLRFGIGEDGIAADKVPKECREPDYQAVCVPAVSG